MWSVEMDDFSGRCGGPRYPLLSTIARILRSDSLRGYSGLGQRAPTYTFIERPAPKLRAKQKVITGPGSNGYRENRNRGSQIQNRGIGVQKRQPSRGRFVKSGAAPKGEPFRRRLSHIPSDLEIIKEVQKLEKELLPKRRQLLGLISQQRKMSNDRPYQRQSPVSKRMHRPRYRRPEGRQSPSILQEPQRVEDVGQPSVENSLFIPGVSVDLPGLQVGTGEFTSRGDLQPLVYTPVPLTPHILPANDEGNFLISTIAEQIKHYCEHRHFRTVYIFALFVFLQISAKICTTRKNILHCLIEHANSRNANLNPREIALFPLIPENSSPRKYLHSQY